MRIAEHRDRAHLPSSLRTSHRSLKRCAVGSSLSAAHADELVQEVMLKVWQKAAGFNPEKLRRAHGLHHCPKLPDRYVSTLTEIDTQLEAEDVGFELESAEPTMALHASRAPYA